MRAKGIYPPPPCFSQVLILKGVNVSSEWRVECGPSHRTLLVNEWREKSLSKFELRLGVRVAPLSRVFAYEWQGKDLRDTECVRVASKGLTERHFCASVRQPSRGGTPTPGVLWKEFGFA